MTKILRLVVLALFLTACYSQYLQTAAAAAYAPSSAWPTIDVNGKIYSVYACRSFDLAVSNRLWDGGDVTICNDKDNIYVKLVLNATNSFQPIDAAVKFDFSIDVELLRGLPPGKLRFKSGILTGLQQWATVLPFSQARPLSTTKSCQNLYYYSIHVDIMNEFGKTDTAWAGNQDTCYSTQDVKGKWFCLLDYANRCTPPDYVPPLTGCTPTSYNEQCMNLVNGTAFGFGNLRINQVTTTTKKWGWVQSIDYNPLGAEINQNIYLGAGQNDITKGLLFGTITYYFTSTYYGYMSVTVAENCYAAQHHAYIGSALPTDYANGKLGYIGGIIYGGQTVLISKTPGSDFSSTRPSKLYMIAHFSGYCWVPKPTLS